MLALVEFCFYMSWRSICAAYLNLTAEVLRSEIAVTPVAACSRD